MSLEIERKFFVANEGWKTAVLRTVRIRDGLIANNKGHKARVRIANDVATIALKSRRRGPVRSEFEYANGLNLTKAKQARELESCRFSRPPAISQPSSRSSLTQSCRCSGSTQHASAPQPAKPVRAAHNAPAGLMARRLPEPPRRRLGLGERPGRDVLRVTRSLIHYEPTRERAMQAFARSWHRDL